MKLLISGEGPSDLGACNNAQGQCEGGDFNPGPMAVWLARLWQERLHYNLLETPGAVVYVSETALNQRAKLNAAGKRMQPLRGKKQAMETGLYFNNALHLGLLALELAAQDGTPVMAVLFRDADGTRSAPGQQWHTKWSSMESGFAAAAFEGGVPLLPKPKSEAWLLCPTQTGRHSHARLEDISGNDDSPQSAKAQLEDFFGSRQSAAQLADWCSDHPTDWEALRTLPSFEAFFQRFEAVADTIAPKGRAR